MAFVSFMLSVLISCSSLPISLMLPTIHLVASGPFIRWHHSYIATISDEKCDGGVEGGVGQLDIKYALLSYFLTPLKCLPLGDTGYMPGVGEWFMIGGVHVCMYGYIRWFMIEGVYCP